MKNDIFYLTGFCSDNRIPVCGQQITQPFKPKMEDPDILEQYQKWLAVAINLVRHASSIGLSVHFQNVIIGDGNCCKEDERPLVEKVAEAAKKEDDRCEACKPKGQPQAAPA